MFENGSIVGIIIMFMFMIALFYAVIFIPEKKRKSKYNIMLEGLKVNDEVMTRSGILGKIYNIEDDSVIIVTGPDKVKLKMRKNGIAALLSDLKEVKK